MERVARGQRALHPENRALSELARSVLFSAFSVGGAKVYWEPQLFDNLPKHGDDQPMKPCA